MSKTVVLGDLGKLKGFDDCLKLDGNTSYFETPTFNLDSSDIFEVYFYADETLQPFDTLVSSDDRGTEFRVDSSMRISLTTSSGSRYFVDDVEVFSGDIFPAYKMFHKLTVMLASPQSFTFWGRRSTGGNNYRGLIKKLTIGGFSYINNGDFGASNLPSTPIGKDGTIVDAQWWKQSVDENYLTPQLYKSTLVSPLTEDQNVIYTNAEPYYPSDDVFWNPYNQDLTYDFIVSKQSLGIGVLNYNSLKLSMGLYL